MRKMHFAKREINKSLIIKNGSRKTNGFVQAEPRSWTKEYLEQFQVFFKARL